MASASSRTINLNAPRDCSEPAAGATEKICFVPVSVLAYYDQYPDTGDGLAKVLICSLTTSIPLSSLALSSKTICRIFFVPYIRRASARIVDVLPVPGGP